MIVHAKTHEEKFLIVYKDALEDPRLSFKAKGLWAYLMTKPARWVVLVEQLIRVGPDKRTSVTGALEELELHGYMEREGYKIEDGRVVRDKERGRERNEDGTWDATTTKVYETPRSQPVSKTSTGQTPRSQPVSIIHRGSSTVDNPRLVSNEEARIEEPPKPPTADAVGGSTAHFRKGMRGTGTSLRERRDAVVRDDEISTASRREAEDLERKVATFPSWPLVQPLDDEHQVRQVALQEPGWSIEQRERAVVNWRRSKELVTV